jgi:hypothetical protein
MTDESPADPLNFDPMYNAVAQASTCWARIENAMAGLLEWLLGYSSDYEALHIYFAPTNTETRFKIVNTMARLRWEKYATHDLKSEWASIINALSHAKDVRNRIAHGEVHGHGRKKRGKLVRQIRLTASPFDVARQFKEPKNQWPGMSVNDVKGAADRFFWVAVRIEEMRDYWMAQAIGPQTSLPGIFVRIIERRQNSGPLSIDLKPPKQKVRP